MSTLNQLLNRKNVRNVIVGGSENLSLYVGEHLFFSYFTNLPFDLLFLPIVLFCFLYLVVLLEVVKPLQLKQLSALAPVLIPQKDWVLFLILQLTNHLLKNFQILKLRIWMPWTKLVWIPYSLTILVIRYPWTLQELLQAFLTTIPSSR